MTHFVGIVVANSEEELEEVLTPYYEGLEVDPYFEEIDVLEMAKHYMIDPENISFLLERVQDWAGRPGVMKDGVIGYNSTYNPDSKWDWYEVGGRWANIGTEGTVSEVMKLFETEGYKPSVFVDSEGWHAEKNWGWFGTYQETSTPDIIHKKSLEHAGKYCYIVDFHI